MCVSRFLDQRDFAVFPVSRHFPYSKDFAVFPVSRHFPYSRDFCVSVTKVIISVLKGSGCFLFLDTFPLQKGPEIG